MDMFLVFLSPVDIFLLKNGENRKLRTLLIWTYKTNIVVEISNHVVFYIQLQQTHFKVATKKGYNQKHNFLNLKHTEYPFYTTILAY